MKITHDMSITENGFLIEEELSPNIAYTPDGFLVCSAVRIGRTGIQVYAPEEVENVEPGTDGLVRIQRTEEEVFRDEVLASGQSKPVVIDHPAEGVSPDNWDRVAVGTMSNVRRDGNYLVADLLITSDIGIEAVVNKKLRQVSLGYSANYKQISPGHGIQTDIILNHLALVEQGRAGPVCSIQDSINNNLSINNKPLQEENNMPQTKDSILSRFLKSWKTFDSEMEEIEKEITGDEDEELEDTRSDEENASGQNSIESRLAKIEEILTKLTATEVTKTTDEDESEKETTDEDELEKSDSGKTEDEDEEEKDLTGDSISKAEILVPGNSLTSKREVLKVVTGDSKKIVDSLLAGNKVKDLSTDAVAVLFQAAASIKAMQNNSKLKTGITTDSTIRKPFTNADWNKVITDFHAKK